MEDSTTMATQNIRDVGIVPASLSGERLDKILAELLARAGEEHGLRGVKRLFEAGRVLVDGRPRPKGFRAPGGAVVSLEQSETADLAVDPSAWPGLRVVAQKSGTMAAVFKPAGLHSEAIAGKNTPSVEAFLPVFWPNQAATLVNRLDRDVTGIVLVALGEWAAETYRRREDAGEVEKTYLAVVRGETEEEYIVKKVLDTADRRRVKVLEEASADPLRKTRFRLLAKLPEMEASLVSVNIGKGARHQIRAHAAAAGHPIIGDALYGTACEEGPLYLHHCCVSFPEFYAKAAPPEPWMVNAPLWSAVQAFMEKL